MIAGLAAATGALVTAPPASAWVSVVNDGGDGAPAVLRLQSGIRKGDLVNFQNALALIDRDAVKKVNGIPLIEVELDSPGGDVVEAVAIGRTIYQNYMMTAVRPGHECVSACVFVLMAGAVHYPADGSRIGVHRPLLASWSHMSSAEAHAKYDSLMDYLRQYFAELGVADRAYDIMMRTASRDMRYFSSGELDQLRLRGEDPAWKALYAEKPARAAAPPPAGYDPPPTLPALDESYRDLVIMPGADEPEIGVRPAAPPARGPKFSWDSLDDGGQLPLDWSAPDIAGFLNRLRAGLVETIGPVRWLLVLLIFEIARARPWPGGPRSAPRRDKQA